MITNTEIEFTFVGMRQCMIVRDVKYHLGGALIATVPAGFVHDGLSRRWGMPARWKRWTEKYRSSALLHDYLLSLPDVPKWKADWLFHGALRSAGVSALEAGLFWLAVRTR